MIVDRSSLTVVDRFDLPVKLGVDEVGLAVVGLVVGDSVSPEMDVGAVGLVSVVVVFDCELHVLQQAFLLAGFRQSS